MRGKKEENWWENRKRNKKRPKKKELKMVLKWPKIEKGGEREKKGIGKGKKGKKRG